MAICSRCLTKWKMSESNTCPECKGKRDKERDKNYNKHKRNKESSAIYNSTRWRKLRKRQLSENPLCINFDICHNVATIADHVKELIDGGEAFDINNLESMCQSCHNTKSSKVKREREKTK